MTSESSNLYTLWNMKRPDQILLWRGQPSQFFSFRRVHLGVREQVYKSRLLMGLNTGEVQSSKR